MKNVMRHKDSQALRMRGNLGGTKKNLILSLSKDAG